MTESRRLIDDDLYVSQKEYYRRTYAEGGEIPWDKAFEDGWLQETIQKIGPAEGRRALEIGAGHGRGARILARAGYRVTGIDYVFEPLIVARNKNSTAANPMYVQADLFEAPCPSGSFDLILDWGVFHHIRRTDTAAFLAAITRLLAKRGRFLLGCFSTRFRHEGEGERKRNWTRHRGHYDRFSTRGELERVFSPRFIINSVAEDPKGLYLINMEKKEPSDDF